jgi:surface antigen
MAVGATIVTASNGEDLLAKYGALEDIITSKYGASLGKVDDLNPKSQWKANDEWMMSLKSNDRTLVSIWNFADGSRIGVIVSADSDHEGSVGLDYQFRNYGVCQREIEAAIY